MKYFISALIFFSLLLIFAGSVNAQKIEVPVAFSSVYPDPTGNVYGPKLDASDGTAVVAAFWSYDGGSFVPLSMRHNSFLKHDWNSILPTTPWSTPKDVVVDHARNIITVGNLPSALDFFVALQDPTGHIIWSKGFDNAGMNDYAPSIAVDSQNNIYVGGWSVPSKGGSETGFIAKIDSAGNLDASFGENGFVTGFSCPIRQVALTPIDQVVVYLLWAGCGAEMIVLDSITGENINSINLPEVEYGEFALDASSNIYVLYYNWEQDSRLDIYNSKLEQLGSFTLPGLGTRGWFRNIATTSYGTFVVASVLYGDQTTIEVYEYDQRGIRLKKGSYTSQSSVRFNDYWIDLDVDEDDNWIIAATGSIYDPKIGDYVKGIVQVKWASSPNDKDADRIYDSVDIDSKAFSDAFDDWISTSGTLTRGDVTVRISKPAERPYLDFKASGSGSNTIALFCNKTKQAEFSDGDGALFGYAGNLDYNVYAGDGIQVIDVPSGATIFLPTGAAGLIDDNQKGRVTVASDPGSTAAVTITFEGITQEVIPGETKTVMVKEVIDSADDGVLDGVWHTSPRQSEFQSTYNEGNVIKPKFTEVLALMDMGLGIMTIVLGLALFWLALSEMKREKSSAARKRKRK